MSEPEITDEVVLALYTECCGFLRAGSHWSEGSMHSAMPHEHTPVVRLIDATKYDTLKEENEKLRREIDVFRRTGIDWPAGTYYT